MPAASSLPLNSGKLEVALPTKCIVVARCEAPGKVRFSKKITLFSALKTCESAVVFSRRKPAKKPPRFRTFLRGIKCDFPPENRTFAKNSGCYFFARKTVLTRVFFKNCFALFKNTALSHVFARAKIVKIADASRQFLIT